MTEGLESVFEQAREVAGDKNLTVMGGGSLAQQCLQSGLADELWIHLAPIVLGAGTRLVEEIGSAPIELERTKLVESAAATHLYFRVV